jgi:hypothetical protein
MISRFAIGGQRRGEIFYRPLPLAAAQISYLAAEETSLRFHWVGDPPFDAGDVEFVAEGTDVAYLNDLPISQSAIGQVFAQNWGLAGFQPSIRLQRDGTQEGSGQFGTRKTKEALSARLINQSEFLYRLTHDTYADYPTLLHSGELAKSGRRFKLPPLDLHSETNPSPGNAIHLAVSNDGRGYQLSIAWKEPESCDMLLTSDQSGAIAQNTVGNCFVSP